MEREASKEGQDRGTKRPRGPDSPASPTKMSAKTALSLVPNLMHYYHPFPQKATSALTSSLPSEPTEQTASPAYRLAWADEPFLLRDDLRPLRLQLEYTKPEKILAEAGIDSTIVVFGSARIRDANVATEALKRAEHDVKKHGEGDGRGERLRIAKKVMENVRFYDAAKEFGEIVTRNSDGNKLVVITGGGPGIMEAANRGATQVPGGRSVGLNIVLPFEQKPNPYITPELCFNFHYFSMRKMHFLGRARALVAFPGGWGTLDELFEALTLIQTKKMAPIPVILFCKKWWDRIMNFENMLDEGVISSTDFELFSYAETPLEAWNQICAFYQDHVIPTKPNH